MKSVTQATAQGNRSHQEDRILTAVIPEGELLVVADGHGGYHASEYVVKNILREWLALPLVFNSDKPEPFLYALFEKLHEGTKGMLSGTTVSLAVIDGKDRATFAVLGDSPIIQNGPWGPWIAPDHNARTNPEERSAAIARGAIYESGYLWECRMDHGLQMARALGDVNLPFLDRRPEVFVRSSAKPSWILVASDGLIDPSHKTVNHDDIINLINNGAEAKELVNRAVRLQTNDNASAIVWRNK